MKKYILVIALAINACFPPCNLDPLFGEQKCSNSSFIVYFDEKLSLVEINEIVKEFEPTYLSESPYLEEEGAVIYNMGINIAKYELKETARELEKKDGVIDVKPEEIHQFTFPGIP